MATTDPPGMVRSTRGLPTPFRGLQSFLKGSSSLECPDYTNRVSSYALWELEGCTPLIDRRRITSSSNLVHLFRGLDTKISCKVILSKPSMCPSRTFTREKSIGLIYVLAIPYAGELTRVDYHPILKWQDIRDQAGTNSMYVNPWQVLQTLYVLRFYRDRFD